MEATICVGAVTAGLSTAALHAMRVAYLQKAPSGHMNACLQQLIDDGVEVLATLPPVLADAPYEDVVPSGLRVCVEVAPGDAADQLIGQVREFAPDVTLIVGWDVDAYREVGRALRNQTTRVLCTDSQWMGTARQWLGVMSAPWYLHRCFDRMFVPGERQRRFARRLGFGVDRIDLGFYSADVSRFEPPDDAVPGADAFVFVGRLVADKGLDLLLEAYDTYRSRVTDPLELVVAGTGPLAADLAGRSGVTALGFVLPATLPEVLRRGSALVLPSRFEPWGVVVHEAVCSGLAVIASTKVGAADDLVVDGVNGVVGPPTVESTLDGLLWWHGCSSENRQRARSVSREHAALFSPARWSATVRALADDGTVR